VYPEKAYALTLKSVDSWRSFQRKENRKRRNSTKGNEGVTGGGWGGRRQQLKEERDGVLGLLGKCSQGPSKEERAYFLEAGGKE